MVFIKGKKMKFCSLRILFIGFLILVGCAGGTRGTGAGSGVDIEGTLRDLTQAPLPNVVVTLVDTMDVAVTDENGFFMIRSATPIGNTFTLNFNTEALQADTAVENLAEDVTMVVLDLAADEEADTVEIVSIETNGSSGGGAPNDSSAAETGPTLPNTDGGQSDEEETPTEPMDTIVPPSIPEPEDVPEGASCYEPFFGSHRPEDVIILTSNEVNVSNVRGSPGKLTIIDLEFGEFLSMEQLEVIGLDGDVILLEGWCV